MDKPLLVFDFDGTLVDSVDSLIACLNDAARSRSLPGSFSREAFAQYSVEQLLRKEGLWFWQVPGFVKEFREHVHQRLSEVFLHPGLAGLLSDLRSHAHLAVVSSNSSANVEEVLAREGVSEYFSVIRSSAYFAKSKHLRGVARELGVARSRVLYVGDETRDVHAARRARIDSLAVTWGLQGEEALLRARPRMLAHDVEEFEHLVKAWMVSSRS